MWLLVFSDVFFCLFWLVGVFALLLFSFGFSTLHSPPLYTSYEVASHSEMGLLGRSTAGVACCLTSS